MRAFTAWLKRSPLLRTRRRRIVTILLCVPLLLCLSYWLFGFVAFADAARVVELKGVVQTQREGEAMWRPAQLNQLLWRKHYVRTGSSSGARLLFFDVSTAELAEDTEVSIVQLAKRRGGSAVDVVLKTWTGKMAVRAVRFVDPSSSFRVDTPTSSTVVRGARFTVEVKEDGATQIDLQDGSAEVKIEDEVVSLKMGERITLEPGGHYQRERVFQPNAQLLLDRANNAWYASGDAFQLELLEGEINQFLAAMSEQPGFFVRDTQVWFTKGQARVATTLLKPTLLDLSAAVGVEVVDGELKPQIKAVAAGVALPVPPPVLDLALEAARGQLEGYLDQAYAFVEFSDVQIGDGYALVVGKKRSDAPIVQ